MPEEGTESLESPQNSSKTSKCIRERCLELEIDLNESDVGTFMSLKRGLRQGKNLDLHVLNGTLMTVPDQLLNWFWLLNTRPSNCRVTTHFHCNLKTGALILAVVSDLIIPRWGSWYCVPSLENAQTEAIDKGFGPPPEYENGICSNLNQIHQLLSQFIDLQECIDKRVPITRLQDFGLPLRFVPRERFVRQVELPKL